MSTDRDDDLPPELREALRQPLEQPVAADPDAMWAAVRANRGERTPIAPRRRSHPRWQPSVFGAAAAALVAAVGVSAWRLLARPATQPFREFASAEGGRTTIALRDGSRVILAPATRLRVPSDFGRESRTVDLLGEAEFTVVHDAAHPFAVRTARATTRDVGTVFVVRSYGEDSNDRIAVEEGEVALGWSGRQSLLMKGDLATVADTALSIVHRADLGVLTAWVQSGLAFRDTPLRDVVRDIGRTYGVPVVLADSTLSARHITASFSRESLEVVLDEITRAIDARYERTPRGVIISRPTPISGTVNAQR